MIEFLSSKDCTFFIHIDKKSNINDFSLVKGKNILFSNKRIPVYWGEYSGIQAILALIEQAVNGPNYFDYCVLLSGSDYPLRSKEYIQNFFEKNREKEFISLIKIPNREAGKPISRINTFRFQSDRPICRFIVKILSKLGLAQRDYRKYLGSLEPYSGNTWWVLTTEACKYILDFVKNNQAICQYFEKTFAPEEMFFHTILGNSKYKLQTHRNIMYEDWSDRGAHPALINEKHINFFEENEKIILNDIWGSGEMLFARKFSDDNLNLVRRIDNMIRKKEKQIIDI